MSLVGLIGQMGLIGPIGLISPISPTAQADAPSQTPVDKNLYDIRLYSHSWFWLWIVLAVLAAAGLGVLLWFWLRPHRQLTPKSAYELALEKLARAKEILREDEPMPYAIFVSETVRSYLGQRFQTPSTRRTTEEFLRLMESDRATPLAEHRELLREFLQSCDLVKFAEYHPHLDELELVQQRATSFVAATKPMPAPANGKS